MAETPSPVRNEPPAPMTVRKTHRPFARPRGKHLKITGEAVYCTRCRAMAPRAAGAVEIALEHTADCPVFPGNEAAA